MKTAEEVINENWGHHAEAPHDIVIKSMEEYGEQFKSKWININDELPENNGYKIIFIKALSGINIASYSNGSWYSMENNKVSEFIGITHWMHLPNKPTT